MEDHEKVKYDLSTLGGLDVNLFKIFATLLFFEEAVDSVYLVINVRIFAWQTFFSSLVLFEVN